MKFAYVCICTHLKKTAHWHKLLVYSCWYISYSQKNFPRIQHHLSMTKLQCLNEPCCTHICIHEGHTRTCLFIDTQSCVKSCQISDDFINQYITSAYQFVQGGFLGISNEGGVKIVNDPLYFLGTGKLKSQRKHYSTIQCYELCHFWQSMQITRYWLSVIFQKSK